MKTSGDLLDECNKKTTRLPFFTEEGWWLILLIAGFMSGVAGAMYYAYIMSPFLK